MTVHFRPYPCPEFDIPAITKAWALMRPNGGARTIMADPNWSFANWSVEGEDRNASKHYATAAITSIMQLPIHVLAADDCTLLTWVTWPNMAEWLELLSAWGFGYASLAWEWIKFNPETGKYAFGGGYGTRKNLEPCLIATRGRPVMRNDVELPLFGLPAGGADRSVRDFIEWNPLDCIRAPRREHSRKPDNQYTRIEALFQGPYVELFGRVRRPGWTSWGDQLGKFDAVPGDYAK